MGTQLEVFVLDVRNTPPTLLSKWISTNLPKRLLLLFLTVLALPKASSRGLAAHIITVHLTQTNRLFWLYKTPLALGLLHDLLHNVQKNKEREGEGRKERQRRGERQTDRQTERHTDGHTDSKAETD